MAFLPNSLRGANKTLYFTDNDFTVIFTSASGLFLLLPLISWTLTNSSETFSQFAYSSVTMEMDATVSSWNGIASFSTVPLRVLFRLVSPMLLTVSCPTGFKLFLKICWLSVFGVSVCFCLVASGHNGNLWPGI